MNQFDPKHYYYHRTDPYRYGNFKQPKFPWDEVVGSVCFALILIFLIWL